MRTSLPILILLIAAGTAAAAGVDVVSWNLHGLPFSGGGCRLPVAGEKILQLRPDLVLLQEVWVHGQAKKLIEQFRAAGYEAAEYHSIAPMRTGGLLVFVDGRRGWRVISSRFVEYRDSGPFWRVWEADGLSGKGMLIVEVEHNGSRSVIIDTHLQSQYGPCRRYENVRKLQLEQLAQTAAKAGAWLIAGDFNTYPDEQLYRDFVATGWTDAVADLRAACKCGTHFDSKTTAGDWIDYVFLNPAVSAVASLIENKKSDDPYSDHQGIYIKIATNR